MVSILSIPVPPTTNTLFRNVRGKGRVRTQRYNTWLNAAGWELNAQRAKPIKGPVSIDISVKPRRGSDIDNRIKAVLDLLVSQKIIEADSYPTLMEVRARWDPQESACRVVVYPLAAELREAA